MWPFRPLTDREKVELHAETVKAASTAEQMAVVALFVLCVAVIASPP
jgi:hypothetical protein